MFTILSTAICQAPIHCQAHAEGHNNRRIGTDPSLEEFIPQVKSEPSLGSTNCLLSKGRLRRAEGRRRNLGAADILKTSRAE